MRKIDYHIHTKYSADSSGEPRDYIAKAISEGLDEICFTDHRDFEYPYCPFELDVDHYFEEMLALKEEFKDYIKIKIGVEIGLDLDFIDEINEFINKYDFDYVIGSIHVIHQTEFYDPAEFFTGKSKEEAHREFFLNTLECVKTFDCFNCLGHMDYIVRYGPYNNKTVNHQLYKDIIDEIFKTLISKNKGIEVNTSGYRDLKVCGFPNFDLVQRYYELGGRIITIGSDSHTSDRVGEHVREVVKEYERIGFEDVSTFSKRIKED